jgi:hypothetical protein
MRAAVSGRSNMARVEVAAVMALATAKRAKDVDVVIYGQSNALVRRLDATSVLGGVAKVVASVGSVGHATYGHTAIARWFDAKRHHRVVIFTDDQAARLGPGQLGPRAADLHLQPGRLPPLGTPRRRARPLHAGRLHGRHLHCHVGAGGRAAFSEAPRRRLCSSPWNYDQWQSAR